MAVADPGEGPADGARAPSRPLHVSGLTHVYRDEKAAQFRLDQARISEFREFADFSGFRRYVLEDLRFPRPQGHKLETFGFVPTLYMPSINIARGHREEACWRCGEAEADRLSAVVFDIDNKDDGRPHVSEEEVAARLASLIPAGRDVEHFTYTTFTSSAGRRKFRLICETDRDATRAEQRDIHILLNEVAFRGQGDGAIHDAGDFVYGPPHVTETTVVHGIPLPVDRILANARELRAERPEDWAPFEKKVSRPVRAATPEELSAMRARIAETSASLEFGGIDDPMVFNDAWRGDYPLTAVQESHYATMLSLLGRVWRKTGGQLSFGDMRQVFDEIDALDAFYMARNYPREKPDEMLRFVMAQPVFDDPRPTADALDWRMRHFKNKFFSNKGL